MVNLPSPPRFDACEVKRYADFFSIVSRYTRLQKAGRQFVGLCPFHSERNPSFFIEPERKIFHCFGCGCGGDVFAFIMRIEGCDLPSALRIAIEITAGVATGSEGRRPSRFAGCEGGAAPCLPKAGSQNSQKDRARVLARLQEAERRLAMIRATNVAASAALATACEPERGTLLESEG